MLAFNFDTSELNRIAGEYGASEKEIRFAFSRALRRTAMTMKARARKGLRGELQLRSAAELRRRLMGFRFKKGKGLGEVSMWFGLNDMRVSAFKGRVKRSAGGVTFGGQEFKGAFAGQNNNGRHTVLRRVGKRRWPVKEETMPIADKAQSYIEDEVFDGIEEVFFKNFEAEIRARTIYGVGNG